MTMYAVLVVYNKPLALSSSFQSALKEPDVQLLVVDNSTDESLSNQEEARQAGAWFLSMDGNRGLSRAYNAAFDYLKTKAGDWVVLLDDDTTVPAAYWKQLRQQNPDAVLLPVVRTSEGRMISPAEMRHDIPHPAHSWDSIEHITGINSGMAIPKQVADSYRYDERLFLDFIDHQFLKDMRETGHRIRVLPADLKQDFSAERPDRATCRQRLRIQKKDLAVYYGRRSWKACFLIMKRKLRLSYQVRSLDVLWW